MATAAEHRHLTLEWVVQQQHDGKGMNPAMKVYDLFSTLACDGVDDIAAIDYEIALEYRKHHDPARLFGENDALIEPVLEWYTTKYVVPTRGTEDARFYPSLEAREVREALPAYLQFPSIISEGLCREIWPQRSYEIDGGRTNHFWNKYITECRSRTLHDFMNRLDPGNKRLLLKAILARIRVKRENSR